MRTTKEIIRPAIIQTVEDKTICDFCGKEIHTEDSGTSDFNSATLEYTNTKTTKHIKISKTDGYKYSDCGSTTVESVDCCYDCWESKVKPWLKSQGIKTQTTETDW